MSGQTWDYILDSTIWSVGGLLLGYSLGRIEKEVHKIYLKVVEGRDPK